MLTTTFGRVISMPSPQTLQGGKPGLGGIGACIGVCAAALERRAAAVRINRGIMVGCLLSLFVVCCCCRDNLRKNNLVG